MARRVREVRNWHLVASVIVGLLMLGVGLLLDIQVVLFRTGTVMTQGTVVSCSYTLLQDCQPTVSFLTEAGQRVTFAASGDYYGLKSGDTLTVRYHPATPQDARADYAEDLLWLFPLLPGIIVAVSLVVLYQRRHGGRSTRKPRHAHVLATKVHHGF